MTASLDNDGKLVVLGQFGKIHGLKGWLKLNSFTTPPENILDYPQLLAVIDQNQKTFKIDQFRRQPKGLLVHVDGYDDPESARQLTGVELSVMADTMPEPIIGEFYWHQLLGMKVVNQQAELFGQVTKLMETGANDVLVIAPTEDSLDDRERLVPYLVDTVIVAVDLDGSTIMVNWEADYLD
ncbi:MAG TPA: ribosome maturation factor RimM [Gammaproteobacteria bacterium]|jgi:16S rRNA processing protein RimM|nr:ribosome maturation factor RimM [Gammaproteobacteria bacterium]